MRAGERVIAARRDRLGRPRAQDVPQKVPGSVVKSNGSSVLVQFDHGPRVWVRRNLLEPAGYVKQEAAA